MRERIADFFNSLFSASGKELGGLLVLGIVIILGIAAVNWLDNITTMGYENYWRYILIISPTSAFILISIFCFFVEASSIIHSIIDDDALIFFARQNQHARFSKDTN